MRKTIAATAAAGALLFGGAGIANATTEAPLTGTTTVLAQQEEDQGSDNTGLWGLVGLLGLAGLAGLMKRDRRPAGPGATGYGNAPRT